MPIEIRELVIKAVVDGKAQQESESPESGGEQNQQDVQKSVEQVMEIIERKKER